MGVMHPKSLHLKKMPELRARDAAGGLQLRESENTRLSAQDSKVSRGGNSRSNEDIAKVARLEEL